MSDTLARMISRQAERDSAAPALKEKIDGTYTDIPWKKVMENIMLYARGLHALGINKGDRVAIMGPNAPEWVYADVGTLSCTAISVPVYHTEGIETLRHIVNDSGSRVLFLASQLLGKQVAEQWESFDKLETVVLLDG
ncbi:MAG: AMP-binding protein, partial [Desulfuromonadales bacterium]|nr:AMP-binding protein [Desulfuromonadales bacterium]NIS43622.1 AMP-binding protein [Desulfuromonadales bacterium]